MGLLESLDGTPEVDTATDDAALVRALLDVEAALVRSLVRAGTAPPDVAEQVERACSGLVVDTDDLGRRAVASGNPVVPLVTQLVAAVPREAAAWVHRGATSQDVLDTALALVAHRALGPITLALARAGDEAARLAADHRGTLCLARTLGQPALPTTFGLRAATWCAGLDAARQRLEAVRSRDLAIQLGGAAGTLAGWEGSGLEVARLLADQLGLVDPEVPWHTERSRVHALAGALASATASTGKVAADVVLGSAPEVAELAEGGGEGHGTSSAMPQKRNPVSSVLVLAAARRTPGLLATVLAAGVHEQERATGSWHAEWVPIRDLLRLAGGAAVRTADLLRDLGVDPARMRAHVDAAGPGLLAERVATAMASSLGRTVAQTVVREALEAATRSRRPFADALADDPRAADLVPRDQLASLLDPAGYLGSADDVVTRVLTRRARGGAR